MARDINDPAVLEDVKFLLDLGVPNSEIARRCDVPITRLVTKFGARRRVEDSRLER